MTCSCVDIDLGTYANQEIVTLPFSTSKYPAGSCQVGIDRCILPDIRELWDSGIPTIESCCGHNKTSGYIAVPEEYEYSMLLHGYSHHPDKPDRKDLFSWPSLPK